MWFSFLGSASGSLFSEMISFVVLWQNKKDYKVKQAYIYLENIAEDILMYSTDIRRYVEGTIKAR